MDARATHVELDPGLRQAPVRANARREPARLRLGPAKRTVEGQRFQRLFRLQMAVILVTIAALTATHFLLAAGQVSFLTTNVIFLAGLAISLVALLATSRFVGTQVAGVFGRLQDSYFGAMHALSEALDAKDQYTGEHAASVEETALATGRAMGLSAAELQAISYGARFHDIGKIGVPERILNKPGPLDETERVAMQRHTVVGEQILAPLEFLAPVLPIVRHEHERWDGGGYPDGLSGERIPIGARIIFVCDAYHAMTSDRPYRAALPTAEAIRRLREGAGNQFDPSVVDVFLEDVLTSG